MNIFIKNKKTFAAILSLSLIAGQANAFNFFGLGSLFSANKVSSKKLNTKKSFSSSNFLRNSTIFSIVAISLTACAWFFWPQIKGLFAPNNRPESDQNTDKANKPGIDPITNQNGGKTPKGILKKGDNNDKNNGDKKKKKVNFLDLQGNTQKEIKEFDKDTPVISQNIDLNKFKEIANPGNEPLFGFTDPTTHKTTWNIKGLKSYIDDKKNFNNKNKFKKFNANCCDKKTSETPLYLAAKNGVLEVVKILVEDCDAIVRNEDIRNAKSDEIKDYLNLKKNLQ